MLRTIKRHPSNLYRPRAPKGNQYHCKNTALCGTGKRRLLFRCRFDIVFVRCMVNEDFLWNISIVVEKYKFWGIPAFVPYFTIIILYNKVCAGINNTLPQYYSSRLVLLLDIFLTLPVSTMEFYHFFWAIEATKRDVLSENIFNISPFVYSTTPRRLEVRCINKQSNKAPQLHCKADSKSERCNRSTIFNVFSVRL